MKTLTGSCMCGDVRYEVTGECREVVACHCVECRKSSGHYTAATATRPENLKLLGDDGLKWYRSSPKAQRGFCQNCGSTLFWKPDSGDRISIFAGSLDGQTGLQMTSHIYSQEKGDYYTIEGDAAQFAIEGAKLVL
ncbi:GFA family protein [Porticoccus sp. W117]|uniref:GFA family protein n=1 Tax=Porticoccus sp. W117 TaxID=3054777 RepID=UPI002595F6FC|nr:GFA family protein [Porticoccus sp. W117]MDM3871904.1 GFA family protein [Porticoccus sp. W117]